GQFGNASLLYDDMYALLALVSAGMNTGNSTVNSTYNYIKSHQNADGGWSGTLNGTSDTDNTALAVLALTSAGESPSSTNITNALNFTKSRQNNDGGFGFSATDPQSNAYSDALAMMAIRAADEDPTSSTWTENNTTPAEHLLSLQRADGSFWQDSFDTTPYAVIALVGKFYPVHGYINSLRVEGKNNTLFDDEMFYSTPYTAVADNSGELFDVLREPSVAVLLETFSASTGTPVLTTDAYGDYFVKGINGENNTGVVGWRYAVDYEIPSLAAERCILKQDEDVLWFYAHVATTVLSRLSIPEAVAVNTGFVAVATYYDQASGTWKPLQGAYVWADINSTETPSEDNGTPFWLSPRNGTPIAGPTDAAGMVYLSLNSSGMLELWCAGEKSLEYPGGDWTQIARSESREVDVVEMEGCNLTPMWSRTYGGNGSEWANDVKSVMDGDKMGTLGTMESEGHGYILAGTINDSGNYDGLLIRTDANGTQMWNRTFGGSNNEVLYSVAVLDDGYILAGYTTSYGAGAPDAWLIKTDENGTEEWNRTFGKVHSDGARAVYQTSDGGFILGGWAYNSDYDVWLIKTDSAGNELWNSTFDGSKSDYCYDMIPTTDGGYIMAGYTNMTPSQHDAWVVKTDCAGNELWNSTFGVSGKDSLVSICNALDGGYIAAGYTGSYDVGEDAWLIKINATGKEQWNRSFGGSGDKAANAVLQFPDGGYLVAGGGEFFGTSPGNAWLIKTDSQGGEQWNKTFSGAADSNFFSLQPTVEGLMLAGYLTPYGAGNRDAWLVKLECAGQEGEPDLTVFMGLSPFAAVGEPMYIVGDVWNIGGGHANNSTLVVFANGTPIENVSVNALASGCDFHFDFNYTPSSEGMLNITAIADYYGVVNESNENNNTRTVYVDVGEMPHAVMYMHPEAVWAKPNSTFSVAVNISSMEPLITAFSNISFNTTALELVSQTNGHYMMQDGVPTTVQKSYDNGVGYALYNETRLSPVGVMGTGTLYTLTFRVKQDAPFGAYPLSFINVSALLKTSGEPVAPMLVPCTVNVSNNTQPTAVGSVKHTINNAHSNTYFNGSASYDPDHTGAGNGIVQYLWDFGDGTITSTTENITSHVYTYYLWNGSSSTYMPFTVNLTVFDSGAAYNYTYIPVVVFMAGDANGDGVANILDAALVGLHWNAAYGGAGYHDGADLNNDDVVNVLDAAIVGLNWNGRAGGV
ncbi:MAG: CARDB domain-containing protein, partial [Methermicoccaceae archaeon]